MNVALCFSGKLGDWDKSRESIRENLIKPLRPDIFLSTWESEHYETFNNVVGVKKYKIMKNSEGDLFPNEEDLPCKPKNALIPMLVNMKSVYDLVLSHEKNNKIKYDVIIRVRPDLIINEQIKKHEIVNSIRNKKIRLPFFESSNIYDHEKEMKKEFSFGFINDQASLPNQVNDQIALGEHSGMKKYMNSISFVKNAINLLWNEGYPEYMIKVPESVLTICLQLSNCKYQKLTGSNPFGNISTRIAKKNGMDKRKTRSTILD